MIGGIVTACGGIYSAVSRIAVFGGNDFGGEATKRKHGSMVLALAPYVGNLLEVGDSCVSRR